MRYTVGAIVFAMLVGLETPVYSLEGTSSSTALSKDLSLEEIRARVITTIPVGARIADIENYLAANTDGHSPIDSKGNVYAIVRGIKGGTFLTSAAAQIVVHFSTSGLADSVKVTAIYTGP